MLRRCRWASSPFYEPWRACQRCEGPYRPEVRYADRVAQPRQAIFQDLRENQAVRANFRGQPVTASRHRETGPYLAREEWLALAEPPSFVCSLRPPWAPYA